jgi:hypothetical protein
MKTIHFSVDETSRDCFAEIPCPICLSNLSIHSPDPDLPDLLLGTCEDCRSWYVMDTSKGEMVRVPLEDLFAEE